MLDSSLCANNLPSGVDTIPEISLSSLVKGMNFGSVEARSYFESEERESSNFNDVFLLFSELLLPFSFEPQLMAINASEMTITMPTMFNVYLLDNNDNF